MANRLITNGVAISFLDIAARATPRTRTTRTEMKSTTPAPPSKAPPVPPDPKATINDVAKLLGLADGTDHAAVTAALAACIDAVKSSSPAAVEAAARRAGLSAREASMLSSQKGASVASVRKYVTIKNAQSASKRGAR